MKVGLTVEMRCPHGSVAFQSHINAAPESIRYCRRELSPGEVWTWNVHEINRNSIAFFAAQSMRPSSLLINGTDTLLDGQSSGDFGLVFGQRDGQLFGDLPFTGNLSSIQVTNESDKANRIDLMFGEVESA